MKARYGEFSAEDQDRLTDRVLHLHAIFVQYKCEIPAEIRQYLQMDSVKLERAIGRYWNDLIRLKEWHDIPDRLHRSKVTAYTIKWLLHCSPVYSTISASKFQLLSEDAQYIIHNSNYLFAQQMIFWALDELDPRDFIDGGRFEPVMTDLMYYMATGAYQEKMAALLFDALILGSEAANGSS